jgi:hypothetical protein
MPNYRNGAAFHFVILRKGDNKLIYPGQCPPVFFAVDNVSVSRTKSPMGFTGQTHGFRGFGLGEDNKIC